MFWLLGDEGLLDCIDDGTMTSSSLMPYIIPNRHAPRSKKSFFHPLGARYHSRSSAPRKSTPSSRSCTASDVSDITCSPSLRAGGQLKAPCSNLLAATHTPDRSKIEQLHTIPSLITKHIQILRIRLSFAELTDSARQAYKTPPHISPRKNQANLHCIRCHIYHDREL